MLAVNVTLASALNDAFAGTNSSMSKHTRCPAVTAMALLTTGSPPAK
jgi:hypothetical protein